AVEKRGASRVTALLFPLLDRAHFPKGLISSLGRRHACSDMVIDEVLQMVSELLVELPFHLPAPEQRANTQMKLPGPTHGRYLVMPASQPARLPPRGAPTVP